MRFVITGGSGFVGQALAEAIRARGDEPIIATRGRHRHQNIGEWIEYDLKDRATVANIVAAKPDGIFHLAWSNTPGSAEIEPAAEVQASLSGTVALFEEIASHLTVPLVFLSSGGTVYGQPETLPIPESHPLRPIGVYGITKHAAERYAAAFRARGTLDVRVARLSNPFGPNQSMAKLQGAASIFARKIVAAEPITVWGDGSVVRDYVSVADAGRALMAIMDLPQDTASSPPTFNIGSGEGLTINELIKTLADAAGASANVTHQKARLFDISANVLDISLIAAEAGWRPRLGLREALMEMVVALKRRIGETS